MNSLVLVEVQQEYKYLLTVWSPDLWNLQTLHSCPSVSSTSSWIRVLLIRFFCFLLKSSWNPAQTTPTTGIFMSCRDTINDHFHLLASKISEVLENAQHSFLNWRLQITVSERPEVVFFKEVIMWTSHWWGWFSLFFLLLSFAGLVIWVWKNNH